MHPKPKHRSPLLIDAYCHSLLPATTGNHSPPYIAAYRHSPPHTVAHSHLLACNFLSHFLTETLICAFIFKILIKMPLLFGLFYLWLFVLCFLSVTIYKILMKTCGYGKMWRHKFHFNGNFATVAINFIDLWQSLKIEIVWTCGGSFIVSFTTAGGMF